MLQRIIVLPLLVLSFDGFDVKKRDEWFRVNPRNLFRSNESLVEIVFPLDLTIILIVATLVIWVVNPPYLIDMELVSILTLRGISRADVDSWNIHNITIK